jgi:hypothetical protein
MRVAHPASDASSTAYVVAAPCRADVMTTTLRSAYAGIEEADPFADLMRQLNRIELGPRRI